MKCDQCDKEATVHEWTKKGGQKVEKHLCEECARKQGVAIQPQQPLSQLFTQLISNAKAAAPGAPPTPISPVGACPTCGTTYAQFRHSGLLGCPGCYKVFENQLGPLLQRAHEGGTHHRGKVPQLIAPLDAPASMPPPSCSPSPSSAPMSWHPDKPAPAKHGPAAVSGPMTASAAAAALQAAAQAEKIKTLRKQLQEAIAAEQYEQAAAIRDELSTLESGAPTPRKPSSGGNATS